MKKVLWVSRHRMTDAQREDLEAALGGPVELLPWRETVKDPAELLPALEDSDAAAAVLPLEHLAWLVRHAGEKPILLPVTERLATGGVHRLPDGREEAEYAYRHARWKRITRLELETENLNKKISARP